jgi:hypothetical protein
MEMGDVAKNIEAGADKLDYREKLHRIGGQLKAASMAKPADATVHPESARPVPAAPAVKSPRAESVAAVSTSRPTSAKGPKKSPPPPQQDAPAALQAAKNEVQQATAARPAAPTPQSARKTDDGGATTGEETVAAVVDADLSLKDADTSELESIPGWSECLYTSMFSAAHHAAYYGYVEVLDMLCRVFDCFVVDTKGRTPLFYACLGNRLDCVVTLVSVDAQWIDVGDEKGDTCLHCAASSNGEDVLKFLLSACEVSPDTANYEGLTPSHVAKSAATLQVRPDVLCAT